MQHVDYTVSGKEDGWETEAQNCNVTAWRYSLIDKTAENSVFSDVFEIRGDGPCRGVTRVLRVESDGVLSEGYGDHGLGVSPSDGQTEAYLKDMGMADQASAWAMVKRRPI